MIKYINKRFDVGPIDSEYEIIWDKSPLKWEITFPQPDYYVPSYGNFLPFFVELAARHTLWLEEKTLIDIECQNLTEDSSHKNLFVFLKKQIILRPGDNGFRRESWEGTHLPDLLPYPLPDKNISLYNPKRYTEHFPLYYIYSGVLLGRSIKQVLSFKSKGSSDPSFWDYENNKPWDDYGDIGMAINNILLDEFAAHWR